MLFVAGLLVAAFAGDGSFPVDGSDARGEFSQASG